MKRSSSEQGSTILMVITVIAVVMAVYEYILLNGSGKIAQERFSRHQEAFLQRHILKSLTDSRLIDCAVSCKDPFLDTIIDNSGNPLYFTSWSSYALIAQCLEISEGNKKVDVKVQVPKFALSSKGFAGTMSKMKKDDKSTFVWLPLPICP